jgi:hypothetical protein
MVALLVTDRKRDKETGENARRKCRLQNKPFWGSGAHAVSYSVGTGDSYPGGKEAGA